jgi:murein DD-endopeptidase MepM/ murein hydrolase activator NlpD
MGNESAGVFMGNKSIALITVASAAAVVFAINALNLDATWIEETDSTTMALAPISLGNPAASATLQTVRPVSPFDQSRVPTPEALPSTYAQRVKVKSGDTLAKILVKAGVGRTETHYIVQALGKKYDPRRIRRGQQITLTFESAPMIIDVSIPPQSDQFVGLTIEPDYKTVVRVARNADGNFVAEEFEKTLNRTAVRAEGTIENSLYVAGRDVGVPAVMIARMIRLMSWDVDFQRDIRTGDSFEVMYEKVTDDRGQHVYNGAVKFVALTLSGKRITVYRHQLEDGSVDYFDEDGKASRKALMRTPIDGARLSSGFGKRRHPILGYNRMHKGVDFAAASGTPVYAAGNGTVAFAGRKGSFGNYIKIRHNGTYQTAYAHLKGFARGVRSGKRVEQGQVIGYVGTTGRSTGPHLHYEVHQGNRQVNPMRVKMPSGRTLKGSELARFKAHKQVQDQLWASLADAEVAAASQD